MIVTVYRPGTLVYHKGQTMMTLRQFVRDCFEMIHENIYADVLDDFCGTTRAHRGSYVRRTGKSDKTDHKD